MELNGWLWFEAQGERVILVIRSELVTDGVHRLNEISVDICRAAPLQASSQQHLAGQGPRTTAELIAALLNQHFVKTP